MANAQPTHDITATIGEYTNRDGEKKKRYLKVGTAFTDQEGRVSLKIDAMPVGPNWSGWLSLYPIRRDGEQRQQQPQPQRAQQTSVPAAYEEEDEIPF